MFEIAFKVNPDSEFYKNYFMKKAEKEKFLELADEFVEKYFLGEWLSLALSDRLTTGRDADFVYKVGEMVSVDDFCKNRWEECAAGIHFALLIYLFALCCKQISGLWREQK